MFEFECVWVKEQVGGEAMSPDGDLPCGEQIAWALKGLKVSGVPSPPRRREAGCWLLWLLGRWG